MKGNTITVVGNLTRDPVLKYLTTGRAVTEFTIACNSGSWDRETQAWVDGEASFFKVECWQAMAENVAEGLRKGDPVIVVGRLNRRTYLQGEVTRESWEIKADTIGPDMRKRSVTLRRVLRQSQPVEGQPQVDEQPAPAEDEVVAEAVADLRRLDPPADLAVAS